MPGAPSFEAFLGERAPWAAARSAPVKPRAVASRRLELADFSEPTTGPVEVVSPPPGAPAAAERSFTFNEDELARACAGAARAAALVAGAEKAASLASYDTVLREQLAAAVAELVALLRGREDALRRTLQGLLTAALEALVPALREARLAAALERVVRRAADESIARRPLVLELPEHDLPTLARRVPALLAEAGLDGGYEIRPIAASDTIRLVCGEFWTELDAAAWASALCEQVRATIDSVSFEPSPAAEEGHERRSV